MADVIPTADGDSKRDRAQLLLVGALALAVVFLSLSLLLNSVIYTENLATRQTDADTRAATTVRFDVVDGFGGAIEHANRNDASGFADRRDTYRSAADALVPMLSNYTASRGVAVAVDRRSVHQGARLVDEDYSDGLVARNGTGDWTVATDAKVRNVQLDVNVSTIDSGDAVEFAFDDGTVERVIIEEDGSGNARIRVEGVSGDNTCALREGRIDVTAGLVDSRRCDALASLRLAEEQNVTIANGDQVEGTFSLVVDRREEGFRTAIDTANYPDQCSPPTTPTYNDTGAQNPYTTTAVYAGTANLTVRSKELNHERTVRAAPGEHGDPPTEPTFTRYDVTPTGSGFDIDWNTTDPNDDVSRVQFEIYNISSGSVDQSFTEAPNGTVSVTGLGNQSAYYINATAVDATSSRLVNEIHHPDGDAGCPP